MKNAEHRFADGHYDKPVSPVELLNLLEKLNPLFEGGQQQDSHESLRCILAYIQDSVRLLNSYRAALNAALEAARAVEPPRAGPSGGVHFRDLHSETTRLSNGTGEIGLEKSTSVSDVGESQDGLECGDLPSEVSPSLPARMCNGRKETFGLGKIPNCSKSTSDSTVQDKTHSALLTSSTCKLSSEKTSAESVKSKPRLARMKCSPEVKQPSSDAGKITSFFSAAAQPKMASALTIQSAPVLDFVECTCGGIVKRSTRCAECEQSTTRTESFQDVEVVAKKAADGESDDGVGENDICASEDDEACWIVKSLEEEERLQADNKYYCEKCGHLVEASRFVEYQMVPAVLTVHIKRFSAFSSAGVFFTKTMDCVTIPFELPCLEKQCRSQQPAMMSKHRYELYAVISHVGLSLSSGHYTAFVRAPSDAHVRNLASQAVACSSAGTTTSVQDPTTAAAKSRGELELELLPKLTVSVDSFSHPVWYECDDDMITAMLQPELEKKLSSGGSTTPYMLFYRRVTT
jgi:hypothetical protein